MSASKTIMATGRGINLMISQWVVYRRNTCSWNHLQKPEGIKPAYGLEIPGRLVQNDQRLNDDIVSGQKLHISTCSVHIPEARHHMDCIFHYAVPRPDQGDKPMIEDKRGIYSDYQRLCRECNWQTWLFGRRNRKNRQRIQMINANIE